jgi:chromosomal replication initiation ATPase DnaA
MIVPRFLKSPIDTSVVNRMKSYNNKTVYKIPSKICDAIKKETGISPLENVKYRGIVVAKSRQLFMSLMAKYSKLNYNSIGLMVGKDHSSVSYSIKVVNNMIDTDKLYKEMYFRIENDIKNL